MPKSHSKGDIEPPDEITSEAAKGFLAGAFKYGSASIIAHMILILPHPLTLSKSGPPAHPQSQSPPRRPFSARSLFSRPVEGFSQWLSPTARIYRGLTPQFKVFLQIVAMVLGGSVWAERRAVEYIEMMRRTKRAERAEAERSGSSR